MIKEYNNLNKMVHTGQGSFKGVRMSLETAAEYLIWRYMMCKPVELVLAAYDYPGCTDPVFWGFTVDNRFDNEFVAGAEYGDGEKFRCESMTHLQNASNHKDSTVEAVVHFIEDCASTYQFMEKGYYTFKCTPTLKKWLQTND